MMWKQLTFTKCLNSFWSPSSEFLLSVSILESLLGVPFSNNVRCQETLGLHLQLLKKNLLNKKILSSFAHSFMQQVCNEHYCFPGHTPIARDTVANTGDRVLALIELTVGGVRKTLNKRLLFKHNGQRKTFFSVHQIGIDLSYFSHSYY